MGVVERVLFFMAFAVLCVSSMAEVYKVGDDIGWDAIGVEFGMEFYKDWSSSRAFKIGDSIVFEYEPQLHNVVQVTHENYKKCNASSPIKIFTSGNDTIPIKTNGHFYYICGVPTHCEMYEQKVDIRVVTRVTPTQLSATTVASSSNPAPSPSSAVTISN
ncbi:hypothetical protein MKX01_003166 [Papaver californicum]|nr:hypothetical protein MKX01_003166 [Papaver californicum]